MLSFLFWYAATLLLWGAYWGLWCLGLCLPRLRQAPRQLATAALVCAGQASALVLPAWFHWAEWLGFTPPLTWVSPLYHPVDWTGKVVSLLLLAVVIYGLKWVTPLEVGLTKPRADSWRPVSLVVALVAGGVLGNAYLTRQHFTTLWWHERLYYATLPGLAEELFYRGVLLGLLGRLFARRFPLLGARTSWAGVVGVLLFALAHQVKFPAYLLGSLQAGNYRAAFQGLFYWVPFWHVSLREQSYYVAMGTLFLWVRERSGSCWAAVGAHCLLNASLTLGTSFS